MKNHCKNYIEEIKTTYTRQERRGVGLKLQKKSTPVSPRRNIPRAAGTSIAWLLIARGGGY